MKLRQVFSCVIAFVLLLSLFAGIQVSAVNEHRYYIDASNLTVSATSTNELFASSVTDLGDHRWSLQMSVSSDGGCYAKFSLRDAAKIRQLPYLVLEVDAASTVSAYALVGTDSNGVMTCPTVPSLGTLSQIGSNCFISGAQTVVFDLGSAVGNNGTYSCMLFLSDAGAGKSFTVNGLYLTDVNPDRAVQTIALSSLTPELIAPQTTVQANGTYGLTISASAGENYAYYNIPRSTVDACPYLYYQLESAVSSPFAWETVCGPNWNENYTGGVLNLSTSLQRIDLRDTPAYQAGGNVLLQFYNPQPIPFSVLMLSNTETFFVSENARYLSVTEAYTASQSLIDPNTSVQKVGKVGAVIGGTAASQSYAYLSVPAETVAEMPYLFIKLSSLPMAGQVTWYNVCGPAYFEHYEKMPIPYDTDLHCIDLRDSEAYKAGSPVLLTLCLPPQSTARFQFDCLVLAADAAFDYTDPDSAGSAAPAKHMVDMYDDTGKLIYTQMVSHGGRIDQSYIDRAEYPNFTWYTDAAHTSAYNVNQPVTRSVKLYADWGVTNTSPVFAQLQKGTSQQADSSSIRFVAAINSLDFSKVGFVISRTDKNPTVGNAQCLDASTTTVYSSVYANGKSVPASALHGKYIYAVTVNNIGNANFDHGIYVRAYTLDKQGNYVYSATKQYCVTDMMATVPETLKVLVIGNSFSINATRHLTPMLNDLGVKEATIGILYHGSASLQVHGQYASNPNAIGYHYYTATNSAVLAETQDVSLDYGLRQQQWDIVAFQHGGGDQGMQNTYDNAIITALIDRVHRYSPNAQIWWHMDWAFADGLLPENDLDNKFHTNYGSSLETMYRAITSSVENVILPDSRFSGIIPSGTLIQRLHFVYSIEEIQYDYKHLSHMGEYAAAACWAASLLGKTTNGIKYYPYNYIGEYGVLEQIQQLMPLVADDPFGKTIPVFDINNAPTAP